MIYQFRWMQVHVFGARHLPKMDRAGMANSLHSWLMLVAKNIQGNYDKTQEYIIQK